MESIPDALCDMLVFFKVVSFTVVFERVVRGHPSKTSGPMGGVNQNLTTSDGGVGM